MPEQIIHTSTGNPKTEPLKRDTKVLPRDNNDENEFATGFKEETQGQSLKSKSVKLNSKLANRLIDMSRLIDRSGKQVQQLGAKICKLSQQMETAIKSSEQKH